MRKFPTREQVEKIKERYPAGTIIRLSDMHDPYRPVPSGTIGEVKDIDDVGSLIMRWQNGQGLHLIPYEDKFEVISRPSELLSAQHTIANSQGENYEGKIIVLKSDVLNQESRTASNQLWLATHGPGCREKSCTGTVHLKHPIDGDKMCVHRSEILGIAQDEVVQEHLQEWLQEQSQEQNQTFTQEMGGL